VLNYAVDGFEVAEQLRRDDPEAFRLLCTVPLRFENDGGDGRSALVHHAPVIALEAGVDAAAAATAPQRARIAAIWFSSKSGGYAPPLEPAVAARYYAARRRFSAMLHSDEFRIAFQLRPGDVWIFDNQRVLHARSKLAAPAVDGARWLQGAYMDRSHLWYSFELLRGQQAAAGIMPSSSSSSSVQQQQQQSQEQAQRHEDCPASSSNDNDDDQCLHTTPTTATTTTTTTTTVAAKDVSFRMVPGKRGVGALADMNKQEIEEMARCYAERVVPQQGARLLRMLEAQRGDRLGAAVDLYEHGVQTASRAYRGGESEELVVASLLHDVTETLVAKNHGGVIAQLLQPWVSPATQWLLANHEVFQLRYYGEHVAGADPNASDRWLTHEHYNATRRWCELYDQAAFDPSYPSLPLGFFVPMLERVLAREPYWWNPEHPKRSCVTQHDD
jgi:predicted HD phosphohydrolase